MWAAPKRRKVELRAVLEQPKLLPTTATSSPPAVEPSAGVMDRMSGGRKGTLMALEVWIPAETENTATSAKDSSSVQITSVAFFRHTASGAPFSRHRVLSASRFSPVRCTNASPAVGTPGSASPSSERMVAVVMAGGATVRTTVLLACPAVTTWSTMPT